MAINSKRKGARGERELAALLSDLLGIDCRRGQQFAGSPDSPDVVGLEGIGLHPECKLVNKLNIEDAMQQAERDCGNLAPVVFHRRDRTAWNVTVRLADLPRVATAIYLAMAGGAR